MLLDFNDDSKTRPIYANIEIIVLQRSRRWSEKSFAFALSPRYCSLFDNKFVSRKQFLYGGICQKTWNDVRRYRFDVEKCKSFVTTNIGLPLVTWTAIDFERIFVFSVYSCYRERASRGCKLLDWQKSQIDEPSWFLNKRRSRLFPLSNGVKLFFFLFL